MATPAQLEANRANAKKSTGPRTAEGKARSAENSFRHGFRSRSPLAPGDDPAEFDALLDELLDHFSSADLTEQRAVREMACAEWRLRRVRRQIEELHAEEFEKIRTQFPDLLQTKLELRTLEALHLPGALYPRLLSYEAQAGREYDRAYRSWRNYQHDCRTAEIQETQLTLRRFEAGLSAPFQRPIGPSQIARTPNTPENTTNEPNFAPAHTPNTTNEPNFTPASAQNRTNEPNSVPPATPRNAPCPCGSGQKFKRCCGRNAPPVLFPAAQAA